MVTIKTMGARALESRRCSLSYVQPKIITKVCERKTIVKLFLTEIFSCLLGDLGGSLYYQN